MNAVEFEIGESVRVTTGAFGRESRGLVGVVQYTPETLLEGGEVTSYYGVEVSGLYPMLPEPNYPRAFPFRADELESADD